MENITITKENYEGYAELFENYYFSDQDNKTLGRNTCISLILLLFSMIVLPILGFKGGILGIACYSSLAVVATTFIATAAVLTKKSQDKIKNKYPNIDVKISFDDLEAALIKANILRYKDNKKKDYTFDFTTFEKLDECETILNDYIEETKYQSIEIEHSIAEEQLEKAKVKVKTLVRK